MLKLVITFEFDSEVLYRFFSYSQDATPGSIIQVTANAESRAAIAYYM